MRNITFIYIIILSSLCHLSCAENQTSQKGNRDNIVVRNSNQTIKDKYRGRTIRFPEKQIAHGLGNITIDFDYPRGYHFTDQAPSQLEWRSSNGRALSFGDDSTRGIVKKIKFPYDIQIESDKGKTELVVEASIYFCADKSGICFFDYVRIIVPIKVSKDGSHKLAFSIDVEAPDKL